MTSRDGQIDSILNKYGLCSYTAPDIHHYQFKKIKYVRPERHISSYIRKSGVYDYDTSKLKYKTKVPYVGLGPVGSHQSGVYETSCTSSSGSYGGGYDLATPSRPRISSLDYMTSDQQESVSTSPRYSGQTALHSEYSYKHGPREYDNDKWYMKRGQYDSLYSPSTTTDIERSSTTGIIYAADSYPPGYESHRDYLDHLLLREKLCIKDRKMKSINIQLEYIQGVDSTGYSYTPFKAPDCGGGIDCKCAGTSHYVSYVYRTCPPYMNCSGRVEYRRSSLPDISKGSCCTKKTSAGMSDAYEYMYKRGVEGSSIQGTRIGYGANFGNYKGLGYNLSGHGAACKCCGGSSGSSNAYDYKSGYGSGGYGSGYGASQFATGTYGASSGISSYGAGGAGSYGSISGGSGAGGDATYRATSRSTYQSGSNYGGGSTYERRSSTSNLYGEPKYLGTDRGTAADRYGVGVGFTTKYDHYERNLTTGGGNTYARAKPMEYGDVISPKPRSTASTYDLGGVGRSGSFSPNKYDSGSPKTTGRTYSPTTYSPTTYSSTNKDRDSGTYSPYSPSSRPTGDYSPPNRDGSIPSKDVSKPISDDYGAKDYSSPTRDSPKAGSQPSSRPISADDGDAADGVPAKSSMAPTSRPSGDLTMSFDDEDIPMEGDDFDEPSIEAGITKPVEKSPTLGMDGEDLPEGDDGDLPSVDAGNKKPVEKPFSAPGDDYSLGEVSMDDIPMDEEPMFDDDGLPVIDPVTKKQVMKQPDANKKPDSDILAGKDAEKPGDKAPIGKPGDKKPSGDDLISDDIPMEDVPMDDESGLPQVDQVNKKGVHKSAPADTVADKKPVDDADKPTGKDAPKPGDKDAGKPDDKKPAGKDAPKPGDKDAGKPDDKKPGAKDAGKPDDKKPAGKDAPGDKDAGKLGKQDEKKPEEKKPQEKKPEEKKPEEKKPEEKKPEEKKPEQKKPEEKKPEEKKPAPKDAAKPKTLGDLPEDKLQAIMRCIEGGEMDFSGVDLDIEVMEAIQRNISKINMDDEQNIIINFFPTANSKEPSSVKLNIRNNMCSVEAGNPRDGRVKIGDVINDKNGKPSKINLSYTPTGKKALNFVFSIQDGLLSLTESDLDPAMVYLYLTDADPVRRKLTPKERRAKEAIISINLQGGQPHEVKLKYGGGKCLAEVINNKDTDCKVTKVVKNQKGDPELVTIAVSPKGSDKPMFLTFRIGEDVIDLVSIEYGGQNVPMKRGKDGSLMLEIPGATPERIVELNMKLGPGDKDISKVTLNFPDGKTCSATSDNKSTVNLVEYKYDDAGVPASAVIDVTPKGKKAPVRFNVVFKDGVPSVTTVAPDVPEDEGQEIVVRFKLSEKDPEPCTVKMLVKDGKLTAEGDKKANVKIVSSKFDSKGEPTEIKLELCPKDKKTGSLFFTCIMENGNLKVVQDEVPKAGAPKGGAAAAPADPTEQELVVRFKLDPSKEPCVVKIGILGDECAAIGDKQATADVVDFKCLPSGEPDYIRLRLDPEDGSVGIFFILRFVNGQLSVEQEDVPPEIDMGSMGLQHSSAEQSMVVRFKLSPDDPNPCEVILRMTAENCTASSDGKANVNVIEYVCTPAGDPEMIKLQLTPQGSPESLYFILRFVDGQVNVESVDAPGDTHQKMMAKDFPAKLLSLKILLKESDKKPVELNLKCQGPMVTNAEADPTYRVLSTEPNKQGVAEVINVQVTHPVTGEVYLLRMRMVDDQVTIEGVELFDMDKIDQYLTICFPNNKEKVKQIKQEIKKADAGDILKIVLQHGARGTAVTTGNVTFDLGPMKDILRKINIASSFDDNDGYTMDGFGADEGYSLEEDTKDSGMLLPEGVSQSAISVNSGGGYSLTLKPAQYEQFKKAGYFNGFSVKSEKNSAGDYVLSMSPQEYQIFQANQAKSAPAADPGQLSVSKDASGYYIMNLTQPQYDMLQANNAFAGISITPNQGSDGKWSIRLSESEWVIFQSNQGSVTSTAVAPQDDGSMQLNVTMDASGQYVMILTQTQFDMLQANGSFNGMSVSATSSNGKYTIKLSEAEWVLFQSNQANIGSIESSGGTATQGGGGNMELQVSMDSSGYYIMVLTQVQWEMLQGNGSFSGMSINASQGGDGSYTIKMSESEWQIFQSNQANVGAGQTSVGGGGGGGGDMELQVSMDASGSYIMNLTQQQFEMLQANGSFNGLRISASQSNGKYTIKLSEAEWQIFQSNQANVGAGQTSGGGGGGGGGDMQLQVSKDSSGSYIMNLTQQQFEMLQANGSFNGLKISASQSNGKYTIKLSEAEWQIFQSNQANAGAGAQQSGGGGGECVLNMELAQFESLKASGGFGDINLKYSTSGNTVSVRMSEKEFKQFQAMQGSNVSIGKDQLSADGGQDVGKVSWGLPDETRTYGTAGKLDMPDLSTADHESQLRDVGKLKGLETEKAAEKPQKKVGKLNIGAFGQQQEPSPPAKRPGKIGSRFGGGKFGGGGLQNDGGAEIQQLKSSMTDHRRALRPNRRAPTSNPVKQLEKRKDVFSEDI